MANLISSNSNNFLPLLGNYWSALSEEEKTLLNSYWNSLSVATDKLYVSLFRSFLSKGIENCPPYFKDTDEYFSITWSGLNQNCQILDGKLTYVIDRVLDIPKLEHRIFEPTFSGNQVEYYYKNVDYTINEGRYIQFNSGLYPRENFSENSVSTLYASSIIKSNPVLFQLYGNSIQFYESYFKSRDYVAHISSGLQEKLYYEYPVPTDGLIFHFSAGQGVTLGSDGEYTWKPVYGNITAATVSGAAPTYTTDSSGNPIFRFDENEDQFFVLTESGLSDYTTLAVAKHTGGRPYILGGDNATHLAYAANSSSSSFTFGVNYDVSAGQIASASQPTHTSDNVAVSLSTRVADGSTGHEAYLNLSGITTSTLPTLSGVANIRYIGKRTGAPVTQFGGDLYDVYLYNRKLSSSEITNIQKYSLVKYSIEPQVSFYDLSVRAIASYYKELVHGLTKFASSSPTITNILHGYNLARGNIFALESGIASVSYPDVTIGSYTYTIPSGLALNIGDGDSVDKFDILVSGTYLWDIVSNSGLIRQYNTGNYDYYNKFLIQDNISGLAFNETFVYNYLDKIKPAGIEYGIITVSGTGIEGNTPSGGRNVGPPAIYTT